MSEVFFYHLTNSSLGQMLPQILDRTLKNNWRVLLRSVDQDQLERIDAQLWGGNNALFLPHGIHGGAHDNNQPVLLTLSRDNLNDAKALLLVHGAKTTAEEVAGYERVSLIFNGNDQMAVDDARADWKILTDAGVKAKYWSQASGRWEMKAEKN
jgi:DNA polymerase-3 subunit chi